MEFKQVSSHVGKVGWEDEWWVRFWGQPQSWVVADVFGEPTYAEEVDSFLTTVEEVLNDRNEEYGDGSKEMTQIATVWSGLLGIEVAPRMVPIMMAALKLVRAANSNKEDHAIDLAGYAFHLNRLDRST